MLEIFATQELVLTHALIFLHKKFFLCVLRICEVISFNYAVFSSPCITALLKLRDNVSFERLLDQFRCDDSRIEIVEYLRKVFSNSRYD